MGISAAGRTREVASTPLRHRPSVNLLKPSYLCKDLNFLQRHLANNPAAQPRSGSAATPQSETAVGQLQPRLESSYVSVHDYYGQSSVPFSFSGSSTSHWDGWALSAPDSAILRVSFTPWSLRDERDHPPGHKAPPYDSHGIITAAPCVCSLCGSLTAAPPLSTTTNRIIPLAYQH